MRALSTTTRQVDTPQNLYDAPDNVFVAGFIGSPSMNLMHATMNGDGGTPTLALGSNNLALPGELIAARPGLRKYHGQPIVVGLRPEDLEDAAALSDSHGSQRITTVTSLIEALGSELIIHFGLDAEPFAIMDAEFEGEDAIAATTDDSGRFTYVARINPRSKARIGQAIELAVDVGRLHFFDPNTGASIHR